MRVNPFYLSNLVDSLNDMQARQQKLSGELSSGVNMSSLSDNPLAAGENVLLLSQIQRDDSFTTSAGMVTGQLQVADSALSSVVSQLTQAISLATSANNGTMSPDNVKAVGQQIAGILSEVEALANTSYQGRFIFAGGQTGTAPFSTSAGITSYAGDSNINYLELPNGQKIQLNVPGDQIFLGAGSSSVFDTLNALVADYATGTVNLAHASQDTASLTTALNYVSQRRVGIDNSLTQLTAASEAVTNEKTQLIAAQTNLIQADLPTIATPLSQTQFQQTALINVIAQLESPANSLFSKM
jgi:flagellar hook-associated protein 3 FlgL